MNLYLHGEIYGYKPYLATPSIATGKVIFDFADLPSPSRSIKKRSVFFGNNNNLYKTEIGVDNTTFTSDVQYSFVCENSQYQVVITRNDGSVFTQPSSSSKLEVDLYDFKQEKVSTTEFKLPSYAYNSYYSYTFNVTDDKYISKIDVYIKNIDDEKYSKYEVKNVKYLTTGSDLVVFFNRVNDNNQPNETDYKSILLKHKTWSWYNSQYDNGFFTFSGTRDVQFLQSGNKKVGSYGIPILDARGTFEISGNTLDCIYLDVMIDPTSASDQFPGWNIGHTRRIVYTIEKLTDDELILKEGTTKLILKP